MSEFQTKLKRIDDQLFKDGGMSSPIDYIEQTSWMMFLKFLEDLENSNKDKAELSSTKYIPILKEEFEWRMWAVPRLNNGEIDINNKLQGEDLKDFVNDKLFPYLESFRNDNNNSNTIQYKIGEIFYKLKNKVQTGSVLRNVIDIIDDMHFRTQEERHELSVFYEERIKGLDSKSKGEYYTPRPLIRAIIQVVAPKIGETIYDGACGSAGFLIESYDYLKNIKGDYSKLSTKEKNVIEKDTLYGQELKPIPYIIANMNMILHGIETPNIKHTDTLMENLADIQDKDRFDIVLANPPFGGTIMDGVIHNFPIQNSKETAYLFLQHFIKKLKRGGRAGIVISNTFLSNGDATELRKFLTKECNLHTILDCPKGVFSAGVSTVVLFFEKGKETKDIYYYQLNLDRNLGKTNPLNENDLKDFLTLQKDKQDSVNSWTININDIDKSTFDMSVKNPNKKAEK